MFLRINENNPQASQIEKVVSCLKNGGIIIYPTDTVYGLGCDINNSRAIERVCKLKKMDPEKANLSFMCHDLSHLSDFAKPISTSTFKLLKKALPGPFTFILEANGNVPKLFRNNKKTVGIRVPKNQICLDIIKALGHPLLSTSAYDISDEGHEYYTDPEELHEKYGKIVDMVIAGGYGGLEPSTVVDCTGDDPLIIRQGAGNLDEYL